MAVYKYSALDETNSVVKGEIEAPNEKEAKLILLEQGRKPIRISEDIFSKASSRASKDKKISGEEIAIFCKQLSIIARSGISIIKGLLMVKEQSNNKKIQELSNNLYINVQRGCSLSEAFRSCGFKMPLLFINMVQVGEISGNLDNIFKEMAAYFQKEIQTNKKVISSLIYPCILLCVSVSVIILFTFFILPEMAKTIIDLGGKMPALTTFLMDSANFVKKNILYIFIGIIILVVLYKKSIPDALKTKVKGYLLFRLPMISEVSKNFMTARFTRTMGILLRTGLSMLDVLETLERVMGNETLSKGIAKTREKLNQGESLSSGLEQMKFFDPMVTNIIAIGEETGNLADSLLDMAEYYDEKFDSGIAKLISMLEPMFTLGMGAVIATIILSAMMPMFNMMGNLSGGG